MQFTIQPLETEVKLKRGEMVAYNWTGAKLQKDIPIGDYEIECKASGYKTLKKKIAIEENKTVNEDLVMEKGSDVPEGMVLWKAARLRWEATIMIMKSQCIE